MNACWSLAALPNGDVWYGYYNTPAFALIHPTPDGSFAVHQFRAGGEIEDPETITFRVDQRGWLWRGGNRGMSVARPADAEAGKWLHFDQSDGLPGVGVNSGSYFEDTDGSIWFGMRSAAGARRKTAWERPLADWRKLKQNMAASEVMSRNVKSWERLARQTDRQAEDRSVAVGPTLSRGPVEVSVGGLDQYGGGSGTVRTPALGAESVYRCQRAARGDLEDRSMAVGPDSIGPASIGCPVEVAVGGLD